MANEKTPEKQMSDSVLEPDTLILPKVISKGRTLQQVVNELNDTYFFSLNRFRLKKEFLERLFDSRVTGNSTLLLDSVLEALLKYVSADDRKDILAMKRTRGESALQFAITRLYDLEKIKFLVEQCKISVNPEWIFSTENPEIKLYLQQHTRLYVAAQKKDVESFKMALKKEKVDLTQYAGASIVDFIQSKIRENQSRNVVVRFFLNRQWNSMLRATAGQIKKQLLMQAKKEKSVSTELLSLLNQCPPEEIYYALRWHDHDHARLYDKFKKLDLREYLNIYLQMEVLKSEEAPFESVGSTAFRIMAQLPKAFSISVAKAVVPQKLEKDQKPEKDKAEAAAEDPITVPTAKRALFVK